MPDQNGLLQVLAERLGLQTPAAPVPVDPLKQALLDQEALKQQQELNPLQRAVIGGIDKTADFVRGLGYFPTDPIPQDASGAYAGGAMLGAAAPLFSAKGIPGMYSRLEKFAEALPETISAGKLKNLLSSGRVAKEEVDWRKVPQFLEGYGQNRQVAKTELVEHLKKNPLDIQVTQKREAPEGISVWDQPENDKTRYPDYTMPKARNYREDLIQLLPSHTSTKLGMTPAEQFEFAPATGEDLFHGHHWDEPNVLVHVRHNERNLPHPNPTGEIIKAADWATPGWHGRRYGVLGPVADTPEDALAELEKYSMSGPKGRMLENVQSDWHQRGAHQGYESDRPALTEEKLAEFDAKVHDTSRQLWDAVNKHQGLVPGFTLGGASNVGAVAGKLIRELGAKEMTPEVQKAFSEIQDLRIALDNAQDARIRASAKGIPDAPFKDNWAELALRQQLLDIANNRQDLEWLGIAPSTELRRRGEVISPEFQDVQLPRTLEKLVKPFGGKVESVDLGIKPKVKIVHNPRIGQHGGFAEINSETGAQDPLVSLLREGIDPDIADRLHSQVPNLQAKIARLTPEMLTRIKESGFPLLTVLAMIEAQKGINKHTAK